MQSDDMTRLSRETVASYARLRGEVADLPGDEVERRERSYLRTLEERPEVARRIHVVCQPGERVASAAALISPLEGATPYALHLYWTLAPDRQATILADIRRVLEDTLEDIGHPAGLELRLDLGRAMEGLEPLLAELGWKRRGERREFKTPVADLPTQWRGPITWRSLDEVGMKLAAETLERAG